MGKGGKNGKRALCANKGEITQYSQGGVPSTGPHFFKEGNKSEARGRTKLGKRTEKERNLVKRTLGKVKGKASSVRVTTVKKRDDQKILSAVKESPEGGKRGWRGTPDVEKKGQ